MGQIIGHIGHGQIYKDPKQRWVPNNVKLLHFVLNFVYTVNQLNFTALQFSLSVIFR